MITILTLQFKNVDDCISASLKSIIYIFILQTFLIQNLRNNSWSVDGNCVIASDFRCWSFNIDDLNVFLKSSNVKFKM